MRVDAVGGAGHQGDVILAVHHLEVVRLGGQNDGDVVHLVGEHAVQHGDGKGIAHFQPVEIGEQLGAGQAAVSRNDRMGALAAHRQAGALQVACSDLQHAIAGAVVDGQLHTDLFNGDVAHNAGAGHIQRIFIGRKTTRKIQRVRVGGDLRIERICRLEIGAVVGIGQLVHILGIGGHSTGLMQLVDVIAEGGV